MNRAVAAAITTVMPFLAAVAAPSAAYAAPACTGATATTVEAVRRHYDDWAGRCVRIEGLAFDGRLWSDRRALLEPSSMWGEETHRSIPIDGQRNSREPRRVEITGRIGSCATANASARAEAARSGEIVMILGRCHTSLEPYIAPAAIRVTSRAPVARLVEAEVPAGERALVPAPATLARRDRHAAAARAMAAALANGDATAFRRYAQPEVQAGLDESAGRARPEWVDRRMRESDRDFRRLTSVRRAFARAGPLKNRQAILLVDRENLGADADDGAAFTACWCRTADCAGRWPVTAFDADNHPSRPYLCVATSDWLLGPEQATVVQVEIPAERAGLAEPE